MRSALYWILSGEKGVAFYVLLALALAMIIYGARVYTILRALSEEITSHEQQRDIQWDRRSKVLESLLPSLAPDSDIQRRVVAAHDAAESGRKTGDSGARQEAEARLSGLIPDFLASIEGQEAIQEKAELLSALEELSSTQSRLIGVEEKLDDSMERYAVIATFLLSVCCSGFCLAVKNKP